MLVVQLGSVPLGSSARVTPLATFGYCLMPDRQSLIASDEQLKVQVSTLRCFAESSLLDDVFVRALLLVVKLGVSEKLNLERWVEDEVEAASVQAPGTAQDVDKATDLSQVVGSKKTLVAEYNRKTPVTVAHAVAVVLR